MRGDERRGLSEWRRVVKRGRSKVSFGVANVRHKLVWDLKLLEKPYDALRLRVLVARFWSAAPSDGSHGTAA